MSDADIAGKILVLQSEIAEREEAVRHLKATLTKTRDAGTYEEGDYLFHVSVTKRFDDATAKANLAPELYASILGKPKADSARAKALLEPEEYERTQKSFDKQIRIDLRKD